MRCCKLNQMHVCPECAEHLIEYSTDSGTQERVVYLFSCSCSFIYIPSLISANILEFARILRFFLSFFFFTTTQMQIFIE